MTFNTLGLTDTLLRAVESTGYTTPTPIQAKAIPAILSGRDVMAAAQTGTGKTAGFTLPLLQLLAGGTPPASNRVRALVLTPTRELAAQVQESIETYGSNEKLHSAVVFGGVNINPQMKSLRRGVDVLVATPGRLLDLYSQNAVNFKDLEVLVLDEADRMLDMGFIRDIRKIMALLPKQRQNLMFSATFSNEIRSLAKTICNDPVEIDVAPRNSTVESISQALYLVEKQDKPALLSQLLQAKSDQALVFSRTKHGADKLVKRLARDNISAAAIHGNKSQNQRTRALSEFKDSKVQVLVATDIAARGIDIDQLARVINFDLPQVAEDYVHRIGRTGRAGASGEAISLVCDEENKQLRAIERLINRKIERLTAQNLPAPSEEPIQIHAPRTQSRPARSAQSARPRSRSSEGSSSRQRRAPRQRSQRQDSVSASAPRSESVQPEAGKERVGGGFWKTLRSGLSGNS